MNRQKQTILSIREKEKTNHFFLLCDNWSRWFTWIIVIISDKKCVVWMHLFMKIVKFQAKNQSKANNQCYVFVRQVLFCCSLFSGVFIYLFIWVFPIWNYIDSWMRRIIVVAFNSDNNSSWSHRVCVISVSSRSLFLLFRYYLLWIIDGLRSKHIQLSCFATSNLIQLF